MKKMRFAVVGYGGMGSYHTKRLAGQYNSNLDPALYELAGVYDILPERNEAARADGFFAYDTYEALVDDATVDIVVVAIPNDQHITVCCELMDAGKSIISEKPVALDCAQLEEMIACAARNHVQFTVHQNRRWDPDYLDMKEVYDRHEMGDVFCIEDRIHGSRGIPGDWRNQKAHGGGMLYDWGIHLIDQMLFMVKEPVASIYCTLSHVSNDDCDDGFKIITGFANGLQYHLEVGTNNFIRLPHWYMLATNGSAVIPEWDSKEGHITMVTDWENKDAVPVVAGAGLTKTMAPRTDDSIKDFPMPDLWENEAVFYENFAKACQGLEEQFVKHSEMRRVMKFVEACFESAAENKTITDFEERCK